jgi:hypothetical protein
MNKGESVRHSLELTALLQESGSVRSICVLVHPLEGI